MLLFNQNLLPILISTISIHPMLLFNCRGFVRSIFSSYFNTSYVIIQQNFRTGESGNNVFQYILCYYSTHTESHLPYRGIGISIHPMLLFN